MFKLMLMIFSQCGFNNIANYKYINKKLRTPSGKNVRYSG